MTDSSTILYIPHGGGPLPLLDHPGHKNLIDFLTALALDRPKAVVVISAHWEMDIPVVTGNARPALIYDYFGFPEQAYEIKYPAPGDTALASGAVARLTRAGIKARTDDRRGFDHGLYIPLSLMLPRADIPCIQISLCADLDPLNHLKIGEALRPLLSEDIWLLGSGFSFHNMGAFGNQGCLARDPDQDNQAFQDWLFDTCAGEKTPPDRQKENLIRWEHAPHARYCHPREEHLLPLMVCAGAAGYRTARTVFDGTIMDRRALAFLWQGAD